MCTGSHSLSKLLLKISMMLKAVAHPKPSGLKALIALADSHWIDAFDNTPILSVNMQALSAAPIHSKFANANSAFTPLIVFDCAATATITLKFNTTRQARPSSQSSQGSCSQQQQTAQGGIHMVQKLCHHRKTVMRKARRIRRMA